MDKEYYTTTEAARVLSVSPDTVLKWVKAGKIHSFRTPGGHCRIPKDAVASLLPGYEEQVPTSNGAAVDDVVYQHCWNFHAGGGTIKEECLGCVVYRSRAVRCYEMRSIPQEFGHLKLHCKTDCDQCDYYRLVAERGPSILVVTTSRSVIDSLGQEALDWNLLMEFATSEYECAMKIDQLRPDFVVVDCAYGKARTRELCRHMHNDPRIPLTRIILASKSPKINECCDADIFAWIRKPFTLSHLTKCLATNGSPTVGLTRNTARS